MSEDGPAKRRKILHWDPTVAPGAPASAASSGGAAPPPAPGGPPPRRRPWVWVGLVALVAFGAWFGWRVHTVLQEWPEEGEVTVVDSPDTPVPESPPPSSPPRAAAEAARTAAESALQNARRQIAGGSGAERLFALERSFADGDRALGRREWDAATARFTAVREGVQRLLSDMRAETEAEALIENFDERYAAARVARAYNPQGLQSAVDLHRRAEEAYRAARFVEARDRAREALAALEAAAAAAQTQLDNALRSGRQALAEGDGPRAQEIFQRILQRLPDEEAAVIGERRAATIADVLLLLSRAQAEEAAGDLPNARTIYARALELDPLAADAQQALSRIDRKLEDQAVTEALARVASLQQAGRWDAAEAEIDALRQRYPANGRVRERAEAFAADRRAARLQISLRAAREAEIANEWSRARQIYLDLFALGFDRPEVVGGIERTGTVLRAEQAFHFNVNAAATAAANHDYQEAISLFNNALANKPGFVSLTMEQEALRELLDRQSRPVPVRIETDGRTLVGYTGPQNRAPAIMGRSEVVELLPGRYRMRGAKARYRSVDVEVIVRAGEPTPVVRLIPTERQ